MNHNGPDCSYSLKVTRVYMNETMDTMSHNPFLHKL